MRLALAGDTMLGRRVGERLRMQPLDAFVDQAIVEIMHAADLVLLNLECAISERGQRWPNPAKPFFFRAPPVAVDLLEHLGVDGVTLANNHALDYGFDALEDTITLLGAAGIALTGAGENEDAARQPMMLHAGSTSVAVVGLTDHPAEFAASADRPGVAYADLRTATPDWVGRAIQRAGADATLVTPHWGPNMVAEPVRHVRRAAGELKQAGATLVAGHSAHVFHGVSPDGVLFDLGDFLDDYARDPVLRNDLGALFIVDFDGSALRCVEVVPLRLDYCRTTIATGEDARWVEQRFRRACQPFGTVVTRQDERLVAPFQPMPPG